MFAAEWGFALCRISFRTLCISFRQKEPRTLVYKILFATTKVGNFVQFCKVFSPVFLYKTLFKHKYNIRFEALSSVFVRIIRFVGKFRYFLPPS